MTEFRKPSTRENLSWCAGFYDGEGCTYLNKSNKITVNVSIKISQVHVEVLNRFKRIMGVGSISFIADPRPGHNDYHVYAVTNYEGVQHCIASMWAFLGGIKREQALGCFYEWQIAQKKFNEHRLNIAAQHGTHSKYVGGCRCRPCTNANTDYNRSYLRYRKGLDLFRQVI